jgi:hypothetical protein
MHGKPGDILAIASDSVNDVFVIQKTIFEKTYELLQD